MRSKNHRSTFIWKSSLTPHTHRVLVALILASIIPPLASGAWAQEDRPPLRPSDKSDPVYVNGEAVYRVGGGVTPPRPLHTPDPEYSEEARKQSHQGVVVLWMIVGPDGKPHSIRVARSLGLGLDEKAIDAVRQWRLEPATKDGKPVAVQINVEVRFRLYQEYCCLVDVLSDTMGVDLNPYFAFVIRDLRKNWAKLTPTRTLSKQGEVTIQFAILKDGRVGDVQIISISGDATFDRAAQHEIAASSLFQPLPAEFKGKDILVRMHFFGSAAMIISPDHVRVVTGEVQQFSAAVGSTKAQAVIWSVSGDGCAAATCGTISETGLYTAPLALPVPPTIMVKAALKTDESEADSVIVTIATRH